MAGPGLPATFGYWRVKLRVCRRRNWQGLPSWQITKPWKRYVLGLIAVLMIPKSPLSSRPTTTSSVSVPPLMTIILRRLIDQTLSLLMSANLRGWMRSPSVGLWLTAKNMRLIALFTPAALRLRAATNGVLAFLFMVLMASLSTITGMTGCDPCMALCRTAFQTCLFAAGCLSSS